MLNGLNGLNGPEELAQGGHTGQGGVVGRLLRTLRPELLLRAVAILISCQGACLYTAYAASTQTSVCNPYSVPLSTTSFGPGLRRGGRSKPVASTDHSGSIKHTRRTGILPRLGGKAAGKMGPASMNDNYFQSLPSANRMPSSGPDAVPRSDTTLQIAVSLLADT
ncbi:uncharacterized protein P884DRAFT_282226 [Thermothelomyces heterothallicus CBS 202.75]|uniref:uncharacterized protein n=1 Tax=Thermothelomyces heterothallicus CBS 202.75 TaxID=1149848 RepID=UPI00374441B6